ncbi:helix-turn-helix transcriptional regulator [Rossellomorea sp. BNER]|uniref:helix-turn-helix transcriptional regulator n=1 Tax=Rossellomorea sp. BNER TaxID=2962031 RepID=UPI003AF30E74|nr:transcriptional regulator [Rossellomorea sp. BNER]
MKVMEGKELASARKRQGLTQQQLSFKLPISRESIAKYETGRQRFPKDLRAITAEAIDDEEYFFVRWNESAGDVSIPYLNGEFIEHHPTSMMILVKNESLEALDHLEKVCWFKPIHKQDESEREEMKKVVFEMLDAAASMINLVALITKEYQFSMVQIFKQWRLTLKARRMQK